MLGDRKSKNSALEARWSSMRSTRSNHEHAWEEIQLLCNPFRGDVTTQLPEGSTRMASVLDTTGVQAADLFVNFLKGSIFPKSIAWVNIGHADPGLEDDVELGAELDSAAIEVLQAMARSNFYAEVTSTIRDFSIIGNSCLLVEEGPPRLGRNGSTFGGLQFTSVPMGDVWWTIGRDGRPDSVVRKIRMSAVQALRFFGEDSTAGMKKAMGMDSQQKLTFVHHVFKNEKKITNGLEFETDLPWVSVYRHIGTEENTIVRESGFNVNPYICSRWQTVGNETYGRGRGHLVRADMKGANELRRQIFLALARDLNPQLLVADESVINLDGMQGNVTVLRNAEFPPQYLHSQSNYQAADEILRQDREMIRKGFLSDHLDEPETQPRSAEESRLRQLRAQQRLSGPADQVETELAGPLVEAVMSIMASAGALPQLTSAAAITGEQDYVDMKFEFVSPFFTAQRQSEAEKVQGYLSFLAQLQQVTGKEEVMDVISLDRSSAYIADFMDVPDYVRATDDEIETIREARGEIAATRNELELAQGTAKAAKDMSQAGGVADGLGGLQ